MAENNYQSDFFNGESPEKKGRKSPLLTKYNTQRFLPYIKIPVEYGVIIAISILMLMIVSYAVGVERGKRVYANRSKEAYKTGTGEIKSKGIVKADISEEKTLDKRNLESTIDHEIMVKAENKIKKVKPEEPKVEDIIESKDPETLPGSSVYIVMLASFKNENSARDEVDRLRWRDIKAHFTTKGSWYQVYASGFSTVDDANRAKLDFEDRYIDCYIKKVK